VIFPHAVTAAVAADISACVQGLYQQRLVIFPHAVIPINAEAKKTWIYTFTPLYVFRA
jgi:hypothetical protein